MSFQETANSWRAKAHLSGARLPILVGVTATALVVVVLVVGGLLNTVASSGLTIESPDAAVQGENEGQDAEAGATSDVSSEETPLCVHVSGAVVAPGVYDVSEGARVQHAIDAAGGFAEGAAMQALNLARVVVDGEQIVVPTQTEVDNASASASAASATASSSADSTSASVAGTWNGKININQASVAELDVLPGVGPSTAEKIVADREANGPFVSPEDLKRVSGIGDKKYEQLADAICVG